MKHAYNPFGIAHPGVFNGACLAEVVDLNDPEQLARVQIRILTADGVEGQDAPIWARVALPFAGNDRGVFFIPDVGDEVLVSFVHGDPRFPIVVGGLWSGSNEAPDSISDGRNVRKVICSKNGVKVILEDEDGQERFVAETPGGQRVTLKDGPGEVLIEDSNGNSVKLESSGITINASAKVTVNASMIEMSAGMVTVNAGMSKFSGVVQADTVISNSVISASYTPGAGNIW